jgi:hypothetical protein
MMGVVDLGPSAGPVTFPICVNDSLLLRNPAECDAGDTSQIISSHLHKVEFV